MISELLSRRAVLQSLATCTGVLPALVRSAAATEAPRIRTCLNTAVLRGHRLPLERVVAIAARAGYDAIEPWLDELHRALRNGRTPQQLRRLFADHGLAVPSLIAFPRWLHEDPAVRREALQEAERTFELAAAVGAAAVAAPPAGVTRGPRIPLATIARRYAHLVRLARKHGVAALLELWGFSVNLGRLADLAYVLIESGEPDAAPLLDVYHLYRGGSDLLAVRHLNAARLPLIHINDYPAQPPREQLTDGHRIYPGDGAAPLTELLRTLYQGGFRGYLSVELFNRTYWQQPPEDVARTARLKSVAVAERALAG